MPDVLLVAATELELGELEGLACGIGPVEAAAATARALALDVPRSVLHVGLAGARGIEPGTLVVGTESVYVDLAAAIPVVARVEPDRSLLAAVRRALPDAPALPIATSAAVTETRVTGTSGASHRSQAETRVTGTSGASHRPHVEAMEGFAVLRACELAGVAAIEVRAISNELGEGDRTRWELARALESLHEALPGLLAALRE